MLWDLQASLHQLPHLTTEGSSRAMSFGFGIGDFIALFNLTNGIRKRLVAAPKEFGVVRGE